MLACCVIVSHLAPMEWATTGFYAVFGFFTLSGYLMTKVLTQTYLPQRHGLIRYLANRALRIFPPFWLALAIAAAIAMAYPDITSRVHPLFFTPESLSDWLRNITLTGLVGVNGARLSPLLIPPSWSLQVEFTYYLILPLLLWHPHIKLFFATLALGYPFAVPGSVYSLYFSPLAGSLPFFLGMLVYDVQHRKGWELPAWSAIPAGLAILFLSVPSAAALAIPLHIKIYSTLLCNVIIIHVLARIDSQSLPALARRADAWLGNLSYPLFLMHIPIATLIYAWFPAWTSPRSFALLALSFIPIHMAAWLVHRAVELPVNRLRSRVKCRPI